MKLSESLLQDKDLGKRIFDKGIEKSKSLLTDVFGLKFTGTDPKIINLNENVENKRFEVKFNLNDRIITALFYYEKKDEDILCEVLSINETTKAEILLAVSTDNFKYIEKSIHDALEHKYDLNFIPLDPEDKDLNIKEVSSDYKGKTWDAVFTADYHESEFTAAYKYNPEASKQVIKVVEHKKHLIYLD